MRCDPRSQGQICICCKNYRNGKYRLKSDWQASDAVANNLSLNRAKCVECSAFVHLDIEYSGTSIIWTHFMELITG
jgi:hypothetical protein